MQVEMEEKESDSKKASSKWVAFTRLIVRFVRLLIGVIGGGSIGLFIANHIPQPNIRAIVLTGASLGGIIAGWQEFLKSSEKEKMKRFMIFFFGSVLGGMLGEIVFSFFFGADLITGYVYGVIIGSIIGFFISKLHNGEAIFAYVFNIFVLGLLGFIIGAVNSLASSGGAGASGSSLYFAGGVGALIGIFLAILVVSTQERRTGKK